MGDLRFYVKACGALVVFALLAGCVTVHTEDHIQVIVVDSPVTVTALPQTHKSAISAKGVLSFLQLFGPMGAWFK